MTATYANFFINQYLLVLVYYTADGNEDKIEQKDDESDDDEENADHSTQEGEDNDYEDDDNFSVNF